MLIVRPIFTFSRRVRKNVRTDFGIPAQSAAEQNELTKQQKDELDDTIVPLKGSSTTNKLLKQIDRQLVYQGQDRYPSKLVNRIQKGAVWGLGGQLLQFNRKMSKQGVQATVESITQYLKNQQTRSIYVHDFGPDLPHIRRWGIIASAYSNRHCYKVAIDLKNSFNDARTYKQFPAHMTGRKDQEWALVEFCDFTVHIMTEEERAQADLQWKWNNPVSEQVIEKYTKMTRHKSRGFFEPIDD